MKRLVTSWALLMALLPASAWACPFCFSGSPRVRMAFFGTTIFLSLLPLGMIGAGVVWIRRLGRGRWADEFDDSDPLP
jgi:hypothetical protein